MSSFFLGIITGGLATLVLLIVGALSLIRFSDIYGLGHWVLNVEAPLPSMWMNLGFWTDREGKPVRQFREATRALLEKMLESASLLIDCDPSKASADLCEAVAVLDVGIGCGDQTVALAELVHAQKRPAFRYVGLTLNSTQLQTAQARLETKFKSNQLSRNDFQLFQADAAKPSSWSASVQASVDSLADKVFSQRWLIGLDCLYHFSPSRRLIFRQAAQGLDANVLAFDLVLGDGATFLESIAVRLLAFFLSCPFNTFLTEEHYKDQLAECGFDRASITIEDVSDHVFAGLATFINTQDTALKPYGISMTGYRLVGKVFAWFDRSRVVKASIIVGRVKSKAQ